MTMTTIAESSKTFTAPVAQGLIALAGIVVRRMKQFARAARHRHDAAMLAGLDDRMLADIGLTRGDLRDAFSQPLWQDPTAVLVSRVGERRASRQRPVPAPAASRRAITAPSIVPPIVAHPVIDVTMYR
jgi:uncharacterized protein YjiS (DUF1127 family)